MNDFDNIKKNYFKNRNIINCSNLNDYKKFNIKKDKYISYVYRIYSKSVDPRYIIDPLLRKNYFLFIKNLLILSIFELFYHITEPFISYKNRKFVFIFGMPHSGTTLVQRILNKHHDISGTSSELITYFLKDKYFKNDKNSKFFFESENDIITLKKRLIFRSFSFFNNNFILNKNPINSVSCFEIIKNFPESKFIIITRNTKSTVNSLLFSMPNEIETDDRLQEIRNRTVAMEPPRPENFEKLLRDDSILQTKLQVEEINSLLIKFYKENQSNVFHLNFDELSQNPRKYFSKIYEFLNIKLNDSIVYPQSLKAKKIHHSLQKYF